MKKWQIILICFWANPVFGYGKTVDIDLEKLVDLCTTYEKALHSIQVKYTYTAPAPNAEELEGWEKGDWGLYTGPQTTLFIAEKPFDKKFLISQELRLQDSRKGLREIYRCRAYNGHTFRDLQINDLKAPPVGTIQKKPLEESGTIINNTPLGFTIFHQWLGGEGRSLLDLLKGRDPNLVFSLNPTVNRINDCDSIELICSMKWGVGKMIKMLGIHFSLDHNYAVVRISKYNRNKVVFEYNVMKFTSIGNRLWFPIECGTLDGEGYTSRISVLEVQINQPFDEHVFELEFPPGTRVNDTITGKQYTIKPTQEQVDQVLEAP